MFVAQTVSLSPDLTVWEGSEWGVDGGGLGIPSMANKNHDNLTISGAMPQLCLCACCILVRSSCNSVSTIQNIETQRRCV